MTEEQSRREPGDGFREGVRSVLGIMGALKDAVEETFQDLLEQGELSPERAREAAKSTVRKAQETVDDMRDRLDLVPRREFEALRQEVADLRRLVEEHAGAGHMHEHPPPAAPEAPAPPTSPPFTPPFTPGPSPITGAASAGPGTSSEETGPDADDAAERPRFTIDDA